MKKTFNVICKAEDIKGLVIGKEYKAIATLQERKGVSATLLTVVYPQASVPRPVPRKEVARTPLWVATEKNGTLRITSRPMVAENTLRGLEYQRIELHRELEMLFESLESQCTSLAKINVA